MSDMQWLATRSSVLRRAKWMVGRTRLLALAVVGAIAASLPLSNANAGDPFRPMVSRCETTFLFTGPVTVEILGTCQMRHLGRVTLFAEQAVQPGPTPGSLLLTTEAVYVAANGDQLHGTIVSVAVFTSPTAVTFTGFETYTGGTGRFASATGTAQVDGGAEFTVFDGGIPVGGTGHFSGLGRLAY